MFVQLWSVVRLAWVWLVLDGLTHILGSWLAFSWSDWSDRVASILTLPFYLGEGGIFFFKCFDILRPCWPCRHWPSLGKPFLRDNKLAWRYIPFICKPNNPKPNSSHFLYQDLTLGHYPPALITTQPGARQLGTVPPPRACWKGLN